MKRHGTEVIETICALKGKLSAAEAARRHSLSRDSVIGIWHRNLTREQREQSDAARARDVGLVNKLRARPSRVGEEPRPKPAAPSGPPALAPVYTRSSVVGAVAAVEAIRRGQCRFPHGDAADPGFRFCAEPTPRGPYCAWHLAVCYTVRAGRDQP